MDIIQNSFSFSSITNIRSRALYNEPEAGQGFEAALAQCTPCESPKQAGFTGSIMNINFAAFGFESESRGDPVMDFIDNLFSHIRQSRESRQADAPAQGDYGFTSAFQSVFGTSGPLIDFINVTTSKLGLSAGQNQALQDIAINNKDATRSRESIDKIAGELKAAGIYA